MECGRPGCTGVHSHSRPYGEWCPSAQEEHAEAQSRYKGTAKGMLTDARHKERMSLYRLMNELGRFARIRRLSEGGLDEEEA